MTQALNRTWQIRKPALLSDRGIVVAQNRIAAQVGADVLGAGGNAVDAAIATSFALGVVEPWMSGMGGGGYMVVRMADGSTPKVIEFGMQSPRGLRLTDYPIVGGKSGDLFPWPRVQDDRNVLGASAVAIPGQVAGMGAAHEHFATRDWATLIAPAIALADAGLQIDWFAQMILAGSARDLARFPASAETFLEDGIYPKSTPWTALGDTRCDQSRLARSLRHVADHGPRSFYEGPLAETLISDLRAAGGRHDMGDLAQYRARVVEAARTRYRDHDIIGTPTLTAGPTLARALALMEDWQPAHTTPDAAAYATWDRAIRQANAERYATMGDTEHEPDPGCTSHFNVVDDAGNMVSVTQTLLSIFGARLMLPESGILMNNGIMWFDPEPGGPNALAPGKKCLSNMCPTILHRADGAHFALGASGGRKIMPAVAQITSMLLDYGMDLDRAFHAPRLDMSLDATTIVDDTLDAPILKALEAELPHITQTRRTIYPLHFACPSAVGRMDGQNSGATEVTAPWPDAVAAG